MVNFPTQCWIQYQILFILTCFRQTCYTTLYNTLYLSWHMLHQHSSWTGLVSVPGSFRGVAPLIVIAPRSTMYYLELCLATLRFTYCNTWAMLLLYTLLQILIVTLHVPLELERTLASLNVYDNCVVWFELDKVPVFSMWELKRNLNPFQLWGIALMSSLDYLCSVDYLCR